MRKVSGYKERPGRIQIRFLPVVVWLAAAVAVGLIFVQRSQRLEVVGIALGQQRDIAATCAGRVRTIPVKLFEDVKQGAILAVIDTVLDNERLQDEMQAEKAVVEAEIKRLRAELSAAEEQLRVESAERENEHEATLRRYSVDVEQNRLKVLELRAVIEPDKVMLRDIELETKILNDLLAKEAVDPYELRKAQLEYETAAKRVEQNEMLLAQTQKDLEDSQERLGLYAQSKPVQPSLGLALNPILEAINVQEKMIDQLYVMRAPKVLISPFDGVVCKINRRAGEAVLEGEAVLTIAAAKPEAVMAWANQNQIAKITPNMTVELVAPGNPPKVVQSQVTEIGPQLELMPERLWQNPNMPQWGCPVLIAYWDELGLRPNELVGVRGL